MRAYVLVNHFILIWQIQREGGYIDLEALPLLIFHLEIARHDAGFTLQRTAGAIGKTIPGRNELLFPHDTAAGYFLYAPLSVKEMPIATAQLDVTVREIANLALIGPHMLALIGSLTGNGMPGLIFRLYKNLNRVGDSFIHDTLKAVI
jgi:hypothetical protein